MSKWDALFGPAETQALKHILSSFTKATGLRATITDAQGEMVCVPDDFQMTEFCQMVQSTSLGRFKCKRCYRLAGADSMTYNGPYIFRCHAGLISWAAPVVIEGHQLASITCGQVLMWEPEDFFWEEIEITTRGLQIDLDCLVAAARQLEVVSAQRVQAAAELLYWIANELARMSGDLLVHKSELRAREEMLLREKRAREEIEGFLKNRSTFMGFQAYQEQILRSVRAGRVDAAACAVEGLFFGVTPLRRRDVRIYATELIINMMRAAVEGGARVEGAITACDEHMKTLIISEIPPSEAGQWLASVAKDFALMARQGRTLEPMGVVARVAEYVSSSRGKRVTVSDVADAVYMSTSGLSKLFRREIGCTASEFINKVTIDEAKKLLRDPQYSVTDVAEELGYNDPSNFCKVFKRLVGVTPGDFRRRETGRGHFEQLA